MSRNRDIPAEMQRQGTRLAWIVLPFVVLLLAVLILRPLLVAPVAKRDGVAAQGALGTVVSEGAMDSKTSPGGSWQWLKVRLANGRVVDASILQPPPVRVGEEVVIRPALGGPFPYRAERAAQPDSLVETGN